MHKSIDLFEMPSWRIIAIGRKRRPGESLRSLICSVGDVFENWFNKLPVTHANTNGCTLSHGAIWKSRSTIKPYVKTFYLFTLAQQKIIKFNEVCKFIYDNYFTNDMILSLTYLQGGLYARITANKYSDISDAVDSFLNENLVETLFKWNNKPCIEIYREPYPNKSSVGAIQIFMPVTPVDRCANGILYYCSYCGRCYQLGEVSELRKCCRSFGLEVKLNCFGDTIFTGGIEDVCVSRKQENKS